jgi:hypothetical protein
MRRSRQDTNLPRADSGPFSIISDSAVKIAFGMYYKSIKAIGVEKMKRMKQAGVLRYILGLVVLMVLIAGCTTSSQKPSQASPALSPGASPSTSFTQLKPQSTFPSSCHATPIYQGGKSNAFVSSDIPWIQAQPATSGIVGHLFYTPFTMAVKSTYRFLHTGGVNPTDGASTKILWTIDHASISDALQIDGTNLSNAGKTFHQTINPSSSPVANLSQNQYPSIVVVPSAGCWQLQITSGQASGTITMWVV